MIGNDIIDLNVARVNSRWQEQRFLDKLFTQQEQAFIVKDAFRFQNIWRFWSMKESAYKIHNRKQRLSRFNPKSFDCMITSETIGTVVFENQTIRTTTKFNSKIIYTTAQLQDTTRITDYVVLKGDLQGDKSIFLKKKTIQAFAESRSMCEDGISIAKDDFGVPRFFIYGKAQDHFLSLTHHGNYGGFAISFP